MEELIKHICRELNIEVPEIEYGYKGNKNAVLEYKDRAVIHLGDLQGYDMIFAIAHELRHLYQIKHDPSIIDIHFDTEDSEEYNRQPSEIDANAYGYKFMVENFGVKPLFQGYSKEVKDLILKRVKEAF